MDAYIGEVWIEAIGCHNLSGFMLYFAPDCTWFQMPENFILSFHRKGDSVSQFGIGPSDTDGSAHCAMVSLITRNHGHTEQISPFHPAMGCPHHNRRSMGSCANNSVNTRDRKSTRLNSSTSASRMPSSA